MKNSSIKLAVLMMAAFAVSCQVSETFDDSYIPEKGDFVIRLGNSTKTTKASDVVSMRVNGAVIDLGTQDGTNFYLEETITRLDGQTNGPDTKGTPAYTENVGVLYRTLGLYAAGKFGNVSFDRVDNEMFNGGWRYKHTYATDPWPSESEQVGFYLRMPETMSATEGEGEAARTVGVTTDLTTAAPYSGGSITFNYTSPSTAEAMQDIGFAYRTMSKEDYKGYGKNGAPFLFNHALTGVKFAIGNTDTDIEDNGISITEVIFKGLYDKGTCTIKPVSEGNYTDNRTNYSSSATGVVVWTGKEATTRSTKTGYSSGTFGAPINFVEKGTEIDEDNTNTYDSFGANGNYPKSFADAGATKNLNDQAASQTFWFIPQNLSRTAAHGEEGDDDYVPGETPVTLTVKYTYKGQTGEWVIDFGKILSTIEWKAGELRTYTLRIADVNVKITDQITMQTTTLEDGLIDVTGSTKSAVAITNTGNTPAFIRAAIVGQWVDENNKPVFAFTEYKDEGIEIHDVPSWYQDQFENHNRVFGTFENLPGYVYGTNQTYPAKLNNWQYNIADGYYYYTKVVQPGDQTGHLDDNGTLVPDPLFTKYTVNSVPVIEVGGHKQKITFVLEVATQAISANKTDGSSWNDSDYAAAWIDAAGR